MESFSVGVRLPVTTGGAVGAGSSRQVGCVVAQEGTWGSPRDSAPPAGTTGRASPVLAVLTGLSLSRAGRVLPCRGAQREDGVHLGLGEDQAAADAVLLCARQRQQPFSFLVVLAGAAHHGLRLPACPLME